MHGDMGRNVHENSSGIDNKNMNTGSDTGTGEAAKAAYTDNGASIHFRQLRWCRHDSYGELAPIVSRFVTGVDGVGTGHGVGTGVGTGGIGSTVNVSSSSSTTTPGSGTPIDIILGADCLFFKEFHVDLLVTLCRLLNIDVNGSDNGDGSGSGTGNKSVDITTDHNTDTASDGETEIQTIYGEVTSLKIPTSPSTTPTLSSIPIPPAPPIPHLPHVPHLPCVYLMQPRRGGTMQLFLDTIAQDSTFSSALDVTVIEDFHPEVC